MKRVDIAPGENNTLQVGHADCCACYPLGDSLKQVDDQCQVKFVDVFASDGETAEIRVVDNEEPYGGWEGVAVVGSAPIIDKDFWRNTVIIPVTLPQSPADTTLHYTI